ncbi:MAG: hypothetical protein J6J60_08740 [Clostridia bacterium]|nr:hypothetical protein [Clostridia bacterium]MBP3597459.1 hypothetical protein [Clostridia bacterium]
MLKIFKDFMIIVILLTMALIQLILKIIITPISKVNVSIKKISKFIKKIIIRSRNRFLRYLLKLSEA